jgi:hypothetical protein
MMVCVPSNRSLTPTLEKSSMRPPGERIRRLAEPDLSAQIRLSKAR